MAPVWSARFGCCGVKGELEAKLFSFLSSVSLLCPDVGLEKILLGVVITSFSDTLTFSLSPDCSVSGPGNLIGGLWPFLACKASCRRRELRGARWLRNAADSWPPTVAEDCWGIVGSEDKRCWLLNLSFSSSMNRPKWLANL